MQPSLLIDSIVRQLTVLIAQLSTTSGLRASLAHVEGLVFLDLVTELEGQGVGRKVIADMFGLALRSYQQKVQRLQESTPERGVSLWEAVLGYIQSHKTASRTQVLARFARDDSATVRGVLNDLVGSGLVYRTGNGEGTVYRAAQADEVQTALEPEKSAALLAHFQALVGTVCAELALAGDEPKHPRVGTSTFSFDVWPEHPLYEPVVGLLEQNRRALVTLWDGARAHDAQHAKPASYERVTFYFGQNVRAGGTSDE